MKRKGTNSRYDKEYAKFVTEVERAELLDKTYRILVHIGKVSSAKDGGLFHVGCTWTPMKRGWRYYMTPARERDYGKSTGTRRIAIWVQKIYTASDKARDRRIKSRCKQRKRECRGDPDPDGLVSGKGD